MVNYCLPLSGYAYLHRSLLRFCSLKTSEAKGLLFTLNTANLDSFSYSHPERKVYESSPSCFFERLVVPCRPYRTEVQLYKAMRVLMRGIDKDALTGEQREATSRLRCLMGNIEYRFFKTYGMEIDDARTVYSLCAWGISPKSDEPAVCLMRDWVLLPSA
jgi:hypothetical protein